MKKFLDLIDVKSIVTLVLVITMAIVLVTGITPNTAVFDLFKTVTTMVITYFFAKTTNYEK